MRSSAIDKEPVAGPVAIDELGLDGDEQFERRFHGGPAKAVYAYASEDLAWWSAQLALPLEPGFIGENLTTAGLDLNGLYPGDELRAGTVVLRVTEPRDPCAKLAARVGVRGFQRAFGRAGRTGVYCAVLRAGYVRCGDVITVVNGVRTGLSIRALVAEKYGTAPDGIGSASGKPR
jgi:MOSC domain-containing protein YiiM